MVFSVVLADVFKKGNDMRHQLKILQGTLGMFLSEGKGISGTAFPKQPEKMLQLYEFEACPYCRRVRQALTALNLDYEVYPCPKNGTLYRPKVLEMMGVTQFPLLIDPNTDTSIQDSARSIDYLFRTYGKVNKAPPSKWQDFPERETKGTLISVLNMLRGMKADNANTKRIAAGKQPEQLLELYGFEMSPYSRVVRERLCELELAFVCRNVAKERWQDAGHSKLRLKMGKYIPKQAGKRESLMNGAMQGRMQVPFLIDPNTGVELFESKNIIKYLDSVYG